RHAENLRHLVPGARLVAVADAVEDRARKVAAELEIEKSFGSVEAMLACKDVEAIIIATPDAFHAPAVSLAAAAGKAMLCEKPLALNLTDARNALAAVAKHKVYFQVGFMRRYDPAYSAAMKRIEAGEIGVPVIFKSLGRDKEGPPLSYYHSQINGMLFYTNSIHDFDLARWMVQDEVTEVHAFTTSVIRPEVTQFGDVVASVVNLKFAKGAIGNIESHAQAQYGYDVRTEIVGSKGSIQIGTLHRTPATFLTAQGSVSPIADYFLSTFADAYLAEMRDFVDRILSGREPSVTGDDGFRALAIAAAAEQSHAQSKVSLVEA
ncbi:MAG: Gfo/Idh/MocA family oxidoreductase, partial [Acidobacteria bacterium]|nr:Gfo/Idh/MocA family oxidoreductase [Acidobacteriota bacterium]